MLPWEGDGFLSMFSEMARQTPTRPYATQNGRVTTFAELDRRSDAFASYLQTSGVNAGQRVATMMHTRPDHIAVILGIAKVGAIWVPLNVRQRGDGLAYLLDKADVSLLILDAELLTEIEPVTSARKVPLVLAEIGKTHAFAWPSLSAVLEDVTVTPTSLPVPSGQALFAISYTSGTSGPPKGVPITHAMLRYAAEAAIRVADLHDGDVMLVWEPLHHIGGAQLILAPVLRQAVLAIVARFSARDFWNQARAVRATHIHYLGGVLQILLKQPPTDQDRKHEVRIAWGGGCVSDIWREFEHRFGVVIRECYGMTETSSIVTCNDDQTEGSIGKPLPWFDVELRNPESGAVADEGEIVVRARTTGPLFAGYLDAPDVTANMLRDGLLYTGDRGSRDAAGHLYFHGRQTDSVRVNGENVSAWEVERVANTYPQVEETALIGVASSIGESDIKLFVRPKQNAEFDVTAFWAWLATRLAKFQIPKYVAVVDAFPRTASERIMKHMLSRDVDDCWRAPDARKP